MEKNPRNDRQIGIVFHHVYVFRHVCAIPMEFVHQIENLLKYARLPNVCYT